MKEMRYLQYERSINIKTEVNKMHMWAHGKNETKIDSEA